MKEKVHIAGLPQAKEQRCIRCYTVLVSFVSEEDRTTHKLVPGAFIVKGPSGRVWMQTEDATGKYQIPCQGERLTSKGLAYPKGRRGAGKKPEVSSPLPAA